MFPPQACPISPQTRLDPAFTRIPQFHYARLSPCTLVANIAIPSHACHVITLLSLLPECHNATSEARTNASLFWSGLSPFASLMLNKQKCPT